MGNLETNRKACSIDDVRRERRARRQSFEMTDEIPLPPRHLRRLVGPIEPNLYSYPDATSVIDEMVPPGTYASVLDFGCGCGRVARGMMGSPRPPTRYLGIDLHPGMVRWCRRHLTPVMRSFEFRHLDVHRRRSLLGWAKPWTRPFPAPGASFDLVLAHSVFTHILQEHAEHYLRESRRVLNRKGVLYATWFLFDKRYFPMMLESENTLFTNVIEPTQAVIYDRTWLETCIERAGLKIIAAKPPQLRGFQWRLLMAPEEQDSERIVIPNEDDAPFVVDSERPKPLASL